MCEKARAILQGEHGVGRVIARPFTGEPGRFQRTADRRDFSLEPPSPTILDVLSAQGVPVTSVGKIWDIFAGRGIGHAIPASNNEEAVDGLVAALRNGPADGLIFVNCVDFDTVWGHRRDPHGYARTLWSGLTSGCRKFRAPMAPGGRPHAGGGPRMRPDPPWHRPYPRVHAAAGGGRTYHPRRRLGNPVHLRGRGRDDCRMVRRGQPRPGSFLRRGRHRLTRPVKGPGRPADHNFRPRPYTSGERRRGAILSREEGATTVTTPPGRRAAVPASP